MSRGYGFVNNDTVGGLLTSLMGIVAIITALGFRKDLPIKESLGPHIIPIGVGILLICGGLIIAWQSRTKPRGFEPQDKVYWFRSVRFLLFLVLLGIYFSVLGTLGYIGSTVAFMILAQVLQGIRWQRAILNGVVLTLVVYALFGLVVKVPLPELSFF